MGKRGAGITVRSTNGGNGEKEIIEKGSQKLKTESDTRTTDGSPATESVISREKDLNLARSFIQCYQASKSGLKKLGILRREGDIIADYAEWLAAGVLGLQLATNTIQAGWDAQDADGNTYQIKSRTVSSINSYTSFNFTEIKQNFDFLVGVFLSQYLELLGIIKVPYEIVEELIHTNKRNVRFRWSKKIASHPKIEKILWRDHPTTSESTD